ncbi:MAG: GTPase HflX [Kiritimatiellales bacterium]|nr:GTPase HflX [Kiritimatiellales bacterium]
MTELYETQKKGADSVLLVGVKLRHEEEWKVKDTMDELAQLVESAGAEVIGRFLCRQPQIKAGHYIGTGKAKEIADWIKEHPVAMVVFDDDLTPAQGRNLEHVLETRVLDRTQLILDIFAQRANTKEGILQVELAQHQYLLPRLRNMWTHLERQKGGIGLRGPGETQLEMDRRRIEDLIKSLKRDLELVRTRRTEQRRGRRRQGWALVSIVGYTNAGKSTLLNHLSGADIYVANQLFATLDPTTRQVDLPNHEPALVTDTVGFIQKLPHHLVDSFKATLEEVVEADLIMHVVDASHPQVDTQIDAVHAVLSEIGALEKPMLFVFNKIDTEKGRNTAKRLARLHPKSVAVSALTGEGIDLLYDQLADCLKGRKLTLRLSVPLSEGKLLASLQKAASILEEEYEGANADLLVRVSPQLAAQCQPFVVEE